jgi:nucleoside-triphosphatase THEP1
MPILVLTGAPGVGKITKVMGLAQILKERRVNVGGIVSREIRINNVRTGFEFIDLATNGRDILASIYWKWPKGWKVLPIRMSLCC